MNDDPKLFPAFKSLENAKKRLPKSRGPYRVLVLNRQGLPIMQMSRIDDFAVIVDDIECGEVTEMVREVYAAIKSYRGLEPSRVAFFFNDEIITVDREGPFIILMVWSNDAFRTETGIENYLHRLEKTLYEELN